MCIYYMYFKEGKRRMGIARAFGENRALGMDYGRYHSAAHTHATLEFDYFLIGS